MRLFKSFVVFSISCVVIFGYIALTATLLVKFGFIPFYLAIASVAAGIATSFYEHLD